jgi:23S rRNA (uridine2552-2'-O)-methyltransferase
MLLPVDMSRWMHERRNDHYHQRAKEEGYRSRASYKLKQIQNRFGLFDEAVYVLDLGAAPGGWLQVAAEHVPEDGLVVGVDLDEIKPLWQPNVVTVVGDMRDPAVQEEVIGYFDGKADVVLSDMAPNVIGDWGVDQYRQIDLARIALRMADRLLKPDGWFVVKIFQGGEHQKFIQEVRAMFEYIKNYKPKASRKQSAERYIVANGLRPDREPPRVRRGLKEEDDEGPLPGDQLFQDPGY